MSRLIKQYPYLNRYQDTMEAYAGSVCLLEILGLDFNVIKEGTIYRMKAKPSFKAYEDRQGVFISFVDFEVEKNGTWISEKKIKTKEYCLDEISVCDAVYAAVAENREIASDETILGFRDEAALDIIPPALKKEGYEICYS